MSARTLWITGVAGFSGRHMAAFAARVPDRPRVVGFDVVEQPDLPLDAFYRTNLCDSRAVAVAAREDPPAWVIHLAGATAPGPDLWSANVGSTIGLAVGLAEGASGARLLGIGSAAEYAQGHPGPIPEHAPVGPTSDYGRSKLAQTLLTTGLPASLGLAALAARTFNLIGPGLPSHLVVGRLCAQFSRLGAHGEIELHHCESRRDFVDVRDAVGAYWRLVRHGRPGEVYNVCSGVATGLRDVVSALARLTATDPRVRTTAARDEQRDPEIVVGDPAKIRTAVSWAPAVGLDRSLGDMLAAITAAGG